MSLMMLYFLLLFTYTFDECLANICDKGRGCLDTYECVDKMCCNLISKSSNFTPNLWLNTSSMCINGSVCLKEEFCYQNHCFLKVIINNFLKIENPQIMLNEIYTILGNTQLLSLLKHRA